MLGCDNLGGLDFCIFMKTRIGCISWFGGLTSANSIKVIPEKHKPLLILLLLLPLLLQLLLQLVILQPLILLQNITNNTTTRTASITTTSAWTAQMTTTNTTTPTTVQLQRLILNTYSSCNCPTSAGKYEIQIWNLNFCKNITKGIN